MLDNMYPFTKAVLLYSGREAHFDFGDFMTACRGVEHTVCFVRIRGKPFKTFGMYTDIAWGDDGKEHTGNGNSFIFRTHRERIDPFDPKNTRMKTKIVTHHPKDGAPEVFHSKNQIFCMASGPAATGGDCMNFAYDYLGHYWKAQGVPLKYILERFEKEKG